MAPFVGLKTPGRPIWEGNPQVLSIHTLSPKSPPPTNAHSSEPYVVTDVKGPGNSNDENFRNNYESPLTWPSRRDFSYVNISGTVTEPNANKCQTWKSLARRPSGADGTVSFNVIPVEGVHLHVEADRRVFVSIGGTTWPCIQRQGLRCRLFERFHRSSRILRLVWSPMKHRVYANLLLSSRTALQVIRTISSLQSNLALSIITDEASHKCELALVVIFDVGIDRLADQQSDHPSCTKADSEVLDGVVTSQLLVYVQYQLLFVMGWPMCFSAV